MMRRLWLGIFVMALALAVSGCGRSPRVSFYTLETAARNEAAPPSQAAPAVVVGPVTLPEVVDRPQLVLRTDANRVEILETHRWAEPLRSEIPRVVAQDLGRLLASSRVAAYQEYAGTEAEYRVLLDLLRFESAPGDSVTVEMEWTIRSGGALGKKRSGRTLKRERATGPSLDAAVAAYRRALAAVSADIAAAIRMDEASRHSAPATPESSPPPVR